MGTLAMAAMGLAAAGWLDRAGLAGVFGAGLVLAIGGGCVGPLNRPSATRSPADGGEGARRGLGRPPSASGGQGDGMGGRTLGLVFDEALAVILLGTLLTALAPPTDGDALCYHLQVPKLFLWGGAAVYEPDLHETVYPLVTELLYAVALAF